MEVHRTVYKCIPYSSEYVLRIMDQSTSGASDMPHENAGHQNLRSIGMLKIFTLPIAYHYEGEFSWYIRDTLANAKSIP